MPTAFWAAIAFAALAAVAAIAALLTRRAPRRSTLASTHQLLRGGAIAAVVVAALFTVVASANTVPVRNVGIVTAYNKPTGKTTGSGFHWTKPWQKIADWDASIQTDDARTNVRIQTGAVAEVVNKVRWQVREEAAPRQYTDYKGDFDNMRRNLFQVEKQAAFNEAFADYNPINQQSGDDGKVVFDLGKMADEVKRILAARLGNDFIIHSVVIPIINHDKATQAAIEAYQKNVADGRNLEQKERNAEVERRIADRLKNLPPEYYINKCLDLAKELNKDPGFCMTGPPTRVSS
nr:SPFH domain-containing protein [Micromonospora sp. NBRC 107566]